MSYDVPFFNNNVTAVKRGDKGRKATGRWWNAVRPLLVGRNNNL